LRNIVTTPSVQGLGYLLRWPRIRHQYPSTRQDSAHPEASYQPVSERVSERARRPAAYLQLHTLHHLPHLLLTSRIPVIQVICINKPFHPSKRNRSHLSHSTPAPALHLSLPSLLFRSFILSNRSNLNALVAVHRRHNSSALPDISATFLLHKLPPYHDQQSCPAHEFCVVHVPITKDQEIPLSQTRPHHLHVVSCLVSC
jgi:hypothetical protein